MFGNVFLIYAAVNYNLNIMVKHTFMFCLI